MCEFNWNLIFSTFSLFGFSAFIHLAFGTFIFSFTLLQWILFLFIISGIFKGIILSLLLFLSLSLSFSLFHHISPLPFSHLLLLLYILSQHFNYCCFYMKNMPIYIFLGSIPLELYVCIAMAVSLFFSSNQTPTKQLIIYPLYFLLNWTSTFQLVPSGHCIMTSIVSMTIHDNITVILPNC